MSAFSHHWRTIREALEAERERLNRNATALEPAFLPAALEVIETPVSPTARWTAKALLALLVVALLWVSLGKVDIVASAPGHVLPTENVKLVQAATTGVVRQIYVRDGDSVRRGQPLVDLDPTVSSAEEEQAARALQAAQLEVARNQAVAGALKGGSLRFNAPAGTDAAVASTQLGLVKAQVAQAEASAAGLAAARQSALSDVVGSAQQIRKYDDTLPLLDKELAALQQLRVKGLIPETRWLELSRQRRTEAGERDAAISQRARASSDVLKFAQQLAESRAQALRQALADLAKAQSDAGIRYEDLAKARQRNRLQRLLAPVDGTVQQLAVHTIGGVAEPVKPLMVVVPRGELMVEAKVLNKDAGFVRAGQSVAVKLDAFPFTQFGTVAGTIEGISSDAIEDKRLGSVYAARIRLATEDISAEGGRKALVSGMTVTADIRTGRRSILSFLLSPIRQARDEAGRER